MVTEVREERRVYTGRRGQLSYGGAGSCRSRSSAPRSLFDNLTAVTIGHNRSLPQSRTPTLLSCGPWPVGVPLAATPSSPSQSFISVLPSQACLFLIHSPPMIHILSPRLLLRCISCHRYRGTAIPNDMRFWHGGYHLWILFWSKETRFSTSSSLSPFWLSGTFVPSDPDGRVLRLDPEAYTAD